MDGYLVSQVSISHAAGSVHGTVGGVHSTACSALGTLSSACPGTRQEKESFPRNTSLLLHCSQSKQRFLLCFVSAGLEAAIVTAGSHPLQPSEEMFRWQEGHFGALEMGGDGRGLESTTLGWQQVRCEELPRAVRYSVHADLRVSLWGVGQHQAPID